MDKSGEEEKKRLPLSLEDKKEIIAKHERGVRLVDIAREYGRNSSTIGTVLKQKAKGEDPGEAEVAEIVSLAKSMGLVVDEKDIEELIEEHNEELSTEDLKALAAVQHSAVEEELFGLETAQEEEEEAASILTSEIKDILRHFQTVADFVEKNHPEVFTSRAIAHFDDVCLSRFRNLVKSRQKQTSLDRFFTKLGEPPSKKGKGAGDS